MHNESATPIDCEISASPTGASALGAIVQTCGLDLNLPVVVRLKSVLTRQATIVLHAPVEQVLENDAIWFLAGRLACFCPEARVSVAVASPNRATTEGFPAFAA